MKLNPVVRATGIIGATAALVTGVTFAALSSSATLTNNSITSASANLQVKSAGVDFAATDTGFDITGVVPGGSAVPVAPFTFSLENSGDTSLAVKVRIPTAEPTWTGGTVANNKVHVLFNCTGALVTTAEVSAKISDLFSLGADLGTISNTTNAGVADCTAQVKMDSDAFSGSGPVSSSDFNLDFVGTAL